MGIERGIKSGDVYTAIVGHLPYVSGGEGYNLVGDIVEVAIGSERERLECSPLRRLPREAEIVLVGTFGTQVLVAAAEIVEVVEGGHTEGVLVHQTYMEGNLREGAQGGAEGRGEFLG